ncbi:hypothetical protein PG987_014408 [Apiospora arundinis]
MDMLNSYLDERRVNVPLLILSCSLVAVLVVRSLATARLDQKEGIDGTLPAPRLWQWDPFLGLDTVISQVRALRGDYYLDWLRALHKGRPNTFSLRFFGNRWFYTMEPEILKAVYATNFRDFGVEPIRRNSRITMPFADKGVNTTDGDDWAFSRVLIKPFFERDVYHNTERIRPFADRFLALFPRTTARPSTFNPSCSAGSSTSTPTSFSVRPSTPYATPPTENLPSTWSRPCAAPACAPSRTASSGPSAGSGGTTPSTRSTRTSTGTSGRRTPSSTSANNAKPRASPLGPERTDLLWLMAGQMRGDLEGLRSQVCLIIVPTNDTTSMFISHCIWFLARHPDSWEKLRQEVAALGKDAPLSFEALRTMPFLNGVMNETHRLIPNNVTQVRACIADSTLPLGGGPDGQSPLRVKKGDIVSVTKTVMYRDPATWGADADEWRPERWDGIRGSWGFLPYGGGPRRCPAQMMVQTEAAYMLARMAREYKRLEARDPNPYRGVMRIGPSNKHGVKIALYK